MIKSWRTKKFYYLVYWSFGHFFRDLKREVAFNILGGGKIKINFQKRENFIIITKLSLNWFSNKIKKLK